MCSVHIGQAYRDKPPEKLFNYFVLVIVEIIVANPISMNIVTSKECFYKVRTLKLSIMRVQYRRSLK